MSGQHGYQLVVIDNGIGGRTTPEAPQGELRKAVIEAVARYAPGSRYVVVDSFARFASTMRDLSRPERIAELGHVGDMTIIAHGGPQGGFHFGDEYVSEAQFSTIREPYDAFARHATIDLLRCVTVGTLGPADTPADRRHRRQVLRAIAASLLPDGGRVGGTADDVEFSSGGGVRLLTPARIGGLWQYVPRGGQYPTTYHSLGLLKRQPQESWAYTTHTLRAGDRVWYLADDYGFSDRGRFTEDVEFLNLDIDFEHLVAGQTIRVPTRAGPRPTLSPPYAAVQREARRPASSGGLTTREPLLRQLGGQVESTPSQPRRAERFGGTIEALDRLQHQAEERERQQRLVQQWQQQLIRRPPSASQYGGPSLLSDLGRHLQSMPPQPPAFTGFGGTMEALDRIQHQAEEREHQQRLVQQWQQQLDRRPFAAGAFGGPSLLAQLGQQFGPMSQPGGAFSGFGGSAYPSSLQMLGTHLGHFG